MFLGFNINTTAFCLGRSSLHLLLLKCSIGYSYILVITFNKLSQGQVTLPSQFSLKNERVQNFQGDLPFDLPCNINLTSYNILSQRTLLKNVIN